MLLSHPEISMIPTYFINLERATARRQHFEAMALERGVSVERIAAVDGSTLSAKEFDSVHPVSNLRRMTMGEVACFMSHKKAWQKVADSVATHGAVFEDDVLISSQLSNLFTDQSWLDSEMEIVKLDKATSGLVHLGHSYKNNLITNIFPLLSTHFGCGGYIISKKFAKYLLEKTSQFLVPVDQALFSTDGLMGTKTKIFQLNPAVCVHQEFCSSSFLSDAASVSYLDKERKKNRRAHSRAKTKTIIHKAFRELNRPIDDLIRFTKNKYFSILDGTKWTKIDFLP